MTILHIEESEHKALKERISHLEQMVTWAAEGRCMACGESLFGRDNRDGDLNPGCRPSKCRKNVFNDTMSAEFEQAWHARMKILEELKGATGAGGA